MRRNAYRTNIWQYRGMNSLSASRQQELGLHPTVKPVAMIADAIKDVSNRSDIAPSHHEQIPTAHVGGPTSSRKLAYSPEAAQARSCRIWPGVKRSGGIA
jgi:hypothetical protein